MPLAARTLCLRGRGTLVGLWALGRGRYPSFFIGWYDAARDLPIEPFNRFVAGSPGTVSLSANGDRLSVACRDILCDAVDIGTNRV